MAPGRRRRRGRAGVVAAGVAGEAGGAREQAIVSVVGQATLPYPWASVTKVLTALAIWIAVEEGTVEWDDPAGPPGSTVAHLLAHASGLAPDSDDLLAAPGTRRIYSNRGFEVAAAHVSARSGLPFHRYVQSGVLEPLGLDATTLSGSPASGASGPLTDLLALGRELQTPTLISAGTLAKVTAVAFRGLAGVPPGLRQPGPQRLGPWRRDPRRQAPALDWGQQLAQDVRALRPVRLVSVGGPGAPVGAGVAGRPAVRAVGDHHLAGAGRRRHLRLWPPVAGRQP